MADAVYVVSVPDSLSASNATKWAGHAAAAWAQFPRARGDARVDDVVRVGTRVASLRGGAV